MQVGNAHTAWRSRVVRLHVACLRPSSARVAWAQVRYIANSEGLWRIATLAFIAAVPAGLPALAASARVGEDMAAGWEVLADVFAAFLLCTSTAPVCPGRGIAVSPAAHAAVSQLSTQSLHHAAAVSTPHSRSEEVSSGRSSAHQSGVPHAAAGALFGPPCMAPEPPTMQQVRNDAQLEVSVLDCLADVVLAQCAATPVEMKRRLIGIVDRGASRPREVTVLQVRAAWPLAWHMRSATTMLHTSPPNPACLECLGQQAASVTFGLECVRKLSALCARGGGALADPDGCVLEVARLTLPVFLGRCDAVLRAFAEHHAQPATLDQTR